MASICKIDVRKTKNLFCPVKLCHDNLEAVFKTNIAIKTNMPHN